MSIHSDKFFAVIKEAKCHGMPVSWFFPEHAMGEEDKEHLAEARRVCSECPIQPVCLEHAVRHEEFGIWAGMSPRQRRSFRRAHNIPFLSFTTQANTWQVNWDAGKWRQKYEKTK